MINQISGYKEFSYTELYEHQNRLHEVPVHAVRRWPMGKRILNRTGSQMVNFGQWLIRMSAVPQQNIINGNDIKS